LGKKKGADKRSVGKKKGLDEKRREKS